MKHLNKAQPFNDLPLLPPNAELETKEILTKTIRASRALAQLNGALRNLPNPSLFLDTLHLQEAKASSEIENIITTNDDLYKALVADMKIDILIQAPPKFLNPLRPDLLQLIGKLLARYFDVAHEGFVALVAADGHDDHGVRAAQVFVGAKGAAGRVGLQKLVLHLLDLLAFPLVGDLLYEGHV